MKNFILFIIGIVIGSIGSYFILSDNFRKEREEILKEMKGYKDYFNENFGK